MYPICSDWQVRSTRKIRACRALASIGRSDRKSARPGGPTECGLSIFDTVLHIPAEPRSFGAPRALTRVILPLTAQPGLRLGVAGICAAAMALACLALAFVLAGAADDPLSKYALAAVFAVAAVIPAAIATTALRDVVADRPTLIVDAEGLRDTRLGDRIGWNAVSAAAIVGTANGIAAVRLTLAVESAPMYNPCRIGGWSVEWRRRRCDRLVAVSLLDKRPHDLAHTIVILAGRHGATISRDTTPRWP